MFKDPYQHSVPSKVMLYRQLGWKHQEDQVGPAFSRMKGDPSGYVALAVYNQQIAVPFGPPTPLPAVGAPRITVTF